MANIAWGEAECYIIIEAECGVLYFIYSTWQGNDLSVTKNFLAITIHITIVLNLLIHYIKSGRTHCLWHSWSYPSLYQLRKTVWNPSGSLPYVYLVLYYYNIALFTPHSACYMENIALFLPLTLPRKFFMYTIYVYMHIHVA